MFFFVLQNSDYITGQIVDLSDKLEHSEVNMHRTYMLESSDSNQSKEPEDKLSKAEKDSSKATIDVIHGLMSQIMKMTIFNKVNNSFY